MGLARSTGLMKERQREIGRRQKWRRSCVMMEELCEPRNAVPDAGRGKTTSSPSPPGTELGPRRLLLDSGLQNVRE